MVLHSVAHDVNMCVIMGLTGNTRLLDELPSKSGEQKKGMYNIGVLHLAYGTVVCDISINTSIIYQYMLSGLFACTNNPRRDWQFDPYKRCYFEHMTSSNMKNGLGILL